MQTDDEPLIASHPEIPREHALQGFDGVRAYAQDAERSRALLEEALAFEPRGENEWETRGEQRGGFYAYDPAPDEPGLPEPAPSTTSPGRARWTSTRPGGSASPRQGYGRRR